MRRWLAQRFRYLQEDTENRQYKFSVLSYLWGRESSIKLGSDGAAAPNPRDDDGVGGF